MDLFDQFPQIEKNLYLAIHPIVRFTTVFLRDGETVIINNVAMEIKTIKTKHIYKHLIRERLKNDHPKFISIEILISKRIFLGIKYIHCHTILLLNQQQEYFSIKFSITFFILTKDLIGWSWLRVPFAVYVNSSLKLSVTFL